MRPAARGISFRDESGRPSDHIFAGIPVPLKKVLESYLERERIGMQRRPSQRFGGCMALLALWLQLVASFTHIHPPDFGFPSHTTLWGLTFSAELRAAPSSDDKGNGVPQDECPICASIYLISNALIEQPPALNAPVSVKSVAVPASGEFHFQISRYFLFRTRAPPVV